MQVVHSVPSKSNSKHSVRYSRIRAGITSRLLWMALRTAQREEQLVTKLYIQFHNFVFSELSPTQVVKMISTYFLSVSLVCPSSTALVWDVLCRV